VAHGREIKKSVRDRYGEIASSDEACCPSCSCGADPIEQAMVIGYSRAESESIPASAVMGLGCGNPTALAGLREGETVLDLGSGGGLDVFLAAQRVGKSGYVIGVDMTQEMVERARRAARLHGYENVEFRVGEMRYLGPLFAPFCSPWQPGRTALRLRPTLLHCTQERRFWRNWPLTSRLEPNSGQFSRPKLSQNRRLAKHKYQNRRSWHCTWKS
jgi:SAM-dependent methyltransferase